MPLHCSYKTWCNFSFPQLRRSLRPFDACPSGCFCCRHGPPLLVILAWSIVPTSMATTTTKYDAKSCSSCLHASPLTSWSCGLPQAATRACKCGILTKPLKSLLVGRSNQSTDSRARLWSGRATRHGDFLAARRRWPRGSCRSRCADAVFKSSCLWLCESLSVLLWPLPTAADTARRAHRSSCVWSVCGPTCTHRG